MIRAHPNDRVLRKLPAPAITDDYIQSFRDERRRVELETERALDQLCREIAALHQRWKCRL